MLKLDFYESGAGETILLTFPSGGIGIVDAHPSATASRPQILELIRDRKVHFACLTHPHRDHGASNALQVQCAQHEHNYLDICSHEPLAHSVLFAGDARHPDKGVFDRLTRRTNVICVSNGLKSPVPGRNPLNIALPGARAVALPPVCNPVVSFTISAEGAIECEAGRCEAVCGA